MIYVPDVVLSKRRWRHGARPRKGYVGDASSQVYEWLLDPRPCIVLTAHHADWRQDPHYPHVSLGQVVNGMRAGLGAALERTASSHGAFEELREDAISYTFKRDSDRTVAEGGAVAFDRFLQKGADGGSRGPRRDGAVTEKPALAIAS